MYTLKIKVTKEILKKAAYCGENSDIVGMNCAFALAVRDIFPDAIIRHKDMAFGKEDWSWVQDSSGKYPEVTNPHPISKEMTAFINEFDENSPMERMEMKEEEFELSIPDEVINRIDLKNILPILKKNRNLVLQKTALDYESNIRS